MKSFEPVFKKLTELFIENLPEYVQKIDEKNPNANEFEEKSLLEASHYILSNAENIIGIKNIHASRNAELNNYIFFFVRGESVSCLHHEVTGFV